MKKMKLGFLFSSALLLAACSGGDSAETNGEDLANMDDDEEETVTFEGYAVKESMTAKWDESEFMHELEDNVNVEINWTNPTPSTADEQTNLLFASNDLPDLFFSAWTFDGADIAEYGDNGQLIPLEDLVEEHAPNIKAIFDARPELKSALTAPDGHIYSIPQYAEEPWDKLSEVIIINTEWLDEVGLDIPETTDEFKEALVAFKEADLSKQGDTIPFSFVIDNANRAPLSLSGSFGVTGNFIGVQDEEVIYAPAEKDEYQDYLNWMHELYAEDLIDQEAFTQDYDVYDSKIGSEDEFVGAYMDWSAYAGRGTSDGAYQFIPPIEGPNGDRGWRNTSGNFSQSGLSITSENENPVRAIKWADQYFEPEVSVQVAKGILGHSLGKDDDGNYANLPLPEGKNEVDWINEKSIGLYTPFILLDDTYAKIKLTEGEEEKVSQVEVYDPYIAEENLPEFIFSPDDASKISVLQSDIEDYTYEMLAKFMMEGFDEQEYDDFIDQLEKLGLSEFLEIQQNYYDEYLLNIEE